jgi:hypothetical protein
MSTSDTDTFVANVCPCGTGRILKHVTTQDNPWSSADISYELDCAACSRAGWGLERSGVWLVLRTSEAAAEAANATWMQTAKPLTDFISALVDGYFMTFGAKSKKSEFEEASRLDIYTHNYRSFLKGRSEGKTTGQLCYGLRNRTWISSLADARGDKNTLDSLIQTYDSKRAAWESAAKAVVRWPLKP